MGVTLRDKTEKVFESRLKIIGSRSENIYLSMAENNLHIYIIYCIPNRYMRIT